MSQQSGAAPTRTAAPSTRLGRFIRWVQEPMGAAIAASVTTIATFGIVLSGMWVINFAMNS